MSRWIEADALKKSLEAWAVNLGNSKMLVKEETEIVIDSAPSIEIIRCRECKWYGNEQKKIYECCTYWAQNGGVLVPMKPNDFCSYGCRSEKPNNCEHITEDGVTCAKYPACDDCLDNPLNKVKGSERLVKGSEQTDCQTCKWWSNYGYCVHRECKGYAARKGVANESSTMDHSDSGDYQDDRADHAAETDSKGHGSEG